METMETPLDPPLISFNNLIHLELLSTIPVSSTVVLHKVSRVSY